MAITPYLIEVIGIDLWHAVEFSRYGCALIPGLTTTGRARPPPPKGQKEKLRPHTRNGQIAIAFPSREASEKTRKIRLLGFREVISLLGLVLKSDVVAGGEE
jgi:hypothetical protein